MKIVSFNVNSIRKRIHQLDDVMRRHNPDIIAVQETKVEDSEFPYDDINQLGYQVAVHGQKGHYGVATLYRHSLIEVQKGFPGDEPDEQRRLLNTCFDIAGQKVWVINGYFPQGENRSHPKKFPYKEAFYRRITALLHDRYTPQQNVIILGDFNVAPHDNDVGIGENNAQRWLRDGKCCFLPEERQWLSRFMEWGLTDTWRHINGERNDVFSWFDYRSRGFDDDPRRGLRIDHIMVSPPLLEHLTGTGIDYDNRAMETPSDHCPVWADFNY